jgi:2-phosphosulfolactate phosphatase
MTRECVRAGWPAVGLVWQDDDPMEIDVLLSPAEFDALAHRDLSRTACVVFDILRATSTAVMALRHGARAVVPVRTVEEALAERRCDPECLLAGERGGVRLLSAVTGGADFDLGNSPREFTPERVAGRTIVTTTTNGTRAIRASAAAAWVGIGAFLNLGAVRLALEQQPWKHVVLVCSGTGEGPAYEDLAAAGALIDRCRSLVTGMSDAATVAMGVWRDCGASSLPIRERALNARRLLELPDLAADVDFCLQIDTVDQVPILRDGRELRVEGAGMPTAPRSGD